MKSYLCLAVAILFEVIATSSLKQSEHFSRPLPTIITIVGYIASFYTVSIAMKTIPVGIVYAIWSGVGIVLITIAGSVFFKEVPDTGAIVGMILIIAGVVVLNMFSNMEVH